MSTAPLQPAATLAVGDKLDKFEIVEQIGAGGMSIVWKAYDRLLNRHVAIKQLLATGAEAESMRDRLKSEVDLPKRIGAEHRHLVRMLDYIDEPRGVFIVMEYVDGQSLEQVLSATREPIPERQTLGIVGATALALQSIHQAGILHRDLKPSNILLPRTGGLKVGDFGLATLMSEQEMLSLGSARYMAPELFADTQEVKPDARADIYSLGMIAYEMLAGREKFEEAFRVVLRDQRNQALRWLKWHGNPRTRATPLREINPQVTGTLSDLVARMMEKDRDMRIASADELLAAIRRHFTNGRDGAVPVPGPGVEPSSVTASKPRARRADASAPTAPLPRRRKLPVIVLGILAGWVVIFLIVGMVLRGQPAKQAQEAKLTAAKAMFEAAREDYSEGRFEDAKGKFDSLAAEWTGSAMLGKGSTARSLLCQARLDLEAEHFDEALANIEKIEKTGEFAKNPGVLQTLRNEATTRASFRKMVVQVEEKLRDKRIADARRLYEEVSKLALPGRDAQRRDELGQQVEMIAKSLQVARVLDRAKQTAATPGGRARAVSELTQANQRYRDPQIAALLAEMTLGSRLDQAKADAQAAEESGKLQDTIAAYEALLSIRPDPAVLEKLRSFKAKSEFEKGQALLADGKTDQAVAAFTRALGLKELPEARAALARINSSAERATFVKAGDQAQADGDLQAALTQYENARKLSSDDDLRKKIRLVRAGLALERAKAALADGDLDAAKSAYLDARELNPDDHSAEQALAEMGKRAEYLKKLKVADALRAEGKLGDAKRAYQRAKDVLPTKEVQQRMDDTEYDSLIAQARVYMNGQKWDNARALLLAAFKMRQSDEVTQLLEEVAKQRTPTDDE